MSRPRDEHLAVIAWLRERGCSRATVHHLIGHLKAGNEARLAAIAVRPSVQLVWEGGRPGELTVADLVVAARRGELPD